MGGMESMSNAPYYDYATRTGARMGNVELVDGMIRDGLWDVYGQVHMGVCAEKCATTQKISRGAQDEYAKMSTERAQKAQREGWIQARDRRRPGSPKKKGRSDRGHRGRGPEERQGRQDSAAQAGLPERRDGNGRQRLRRSTTAPPRWS